MLGNPKKLHERWHKCSCGCSLDGDHNASVRVRFVQSKPSNRGMTQGKRYVGNYVLMTTAVLLRSGMMGNYHVPFWRAVEGVTPSLTLIIKNRSVGHPDFKAQLMSYAVAGVTDKPTPTASCRCGSMSLLVKLV